MTKKQPEKKAINNRKLLTSIHGAYTLTNTPEQNDSELEIIMINNFLNTLAETALAIAARKGIDKEEKG